MSSPRPDGDPEPSSGPWSEVPAQPGPSSEGPAQPGPWSEVPAQPGPWSEVPAQPGPWSEVPAQPGPWSEVPAQPDPRSRRAAPSDPTRPMESQGSWSPMPRDSVSPGAVPRDRDDTEPFEPRDLEAGRRRTRRHLVGLVIARTWHKLFEDRILGMAAEAGFWAIVSLPSLLLILLGAIGYLRGILGEGDVDQIHDEVLRAARDVLTPGTVNADVAPIVNQVLAGGHLEVISVGFLISLWAGSAAMSDYVNTITVAYGMRGLRSAWRSRLVATLLYICFVAAGVVLLPALALGPDILSQLAPNRIAGTVSFAIRVVYWPLVGLLSVVLLTTLYRLALPVRVRWRRGLPGAVLAMALWLVFSFSLRAYLTSSLRAHSAYGSLAAPIAALLFFYVTALAVLIGAEVNSAIDYVSPVPTTAAGRARARLQAEGQESGR